MVAIDGRENWLVHNHLNREDETFESVDRDASIRAILEQYDLEFGDVMRIGTDGLARRLDFLERYYAGGETEDSKGGASDYEFELQW